MNADLPTDAEARGITDYVQAHSFDDAQCAECGTVRWEHPAHFLDFLAPLIRAREAAAWAVLAAARPAIEREAKAAALEDAADDLEALVDGQHPDAVNPDQWLRDRAYRIEA